MNNNKENLEGIVSKLKQEGIQAGDAEKQRIINEAKRQAESIIDQAKALSDKLIEEARSKSEQVEKNAQTAIAQASRDMIEATKVSILKYLKAVFGEQCKSLFTEKEYLGELLKAVLNDVSGEKTVQVPEKMQKDMEDFLLKQSLDQQIELKPLAGSSAKIIINTTANGGVQFVLSSRDIEDGMFSLLNKELVKRITQKTED
jgi:V/A-type H+-transporting ATPase subunit E